MGIALHPSGTDQAAPLPQSLRFQISRDHGRHPGIQVGSVRQPEASWLLAEAQRFTRLKMACLKTLTVDQRSAIVNAVILPKLLYVGEHAWPTLATVPRVKAWLDSDLSGLPRT
ncbi:hypothetical protein PI125_g15903 [Phytophthora idaei]|nr:hypothetical protein PI125_g15903 [Phytophthora idaei]